MNLLVILCCTLLKQLRYKCSWPDPRSQRQIPLSPPTERFILSCLSHILSKFNEISMQSIQPFVWLTSFHALICFIKPGCLVFIMFTHSRMHSEVSEIPHIHLYCLCSRKVFWHSKPSLDMGTVNHHAITYQSFASMIPTGSSSLI